MQLYAVLLLIFLFTVVPTFAWINYNGEDLEQVSAALQWDSAVSACLGNYSVVASPLDPDVSEAVIQLALTVPGNIFWTGFKRNHPDGKSEEEWIDHFYHATNESFIWRSGYTGFETGDCLAMEVLPIGITYFPADCNSAFGVICHKFEVTHPTEERSESLTILPTYYGVHNVTDEDDCARICIIDLMCIGYKFDGGFCYTLNETSFVNQTFVPEEDCTEWNQTVCDAIDCQCNETYCEIDTCSLGENITECGFSDCTNSSLCSVYTNNTCSMNETIVYINCTTVNGTICVELTTPGPTLFTYTTIQGCVLPFDPLNGGLNGESNYTYNSTRDIVCNNEYTSTTINDSSTIHCNTDRRWDYLRHCFIKAPNCPLGWFKFKGNCYQIQQPTVSWFNQTCDTYNAFSVYIESKEEAEFIDKLLYYNRNQSFWTGGANVNVRTEKRFYWNHTFQDIDFTRWETKSSNYTKNQCILLKAVNETFYYEVDDCLNEKSYICKKGRVLIGGDCVKDSWCIGRSECRNTCKCRSGQTLYGLLIDDPDAYCGNGKIDLADSTLIKLDDKPWELAVAECTSLDGSLLTALTNDWQDILFTHYGVSGLDIKFWTGLYFANGTLQMQGVTQYAVSDLLTQIPWKTVFNEKWTEDYCIYQRTSLLGVRYGAKKCKFDTRAICHIHDYSVYFGQNTDNLGRTPFMMYHPVITDTACFLRCRYHQECVSLSYYPGDNICKLYGTKDIGINSDAPNLHMYVTGCMVAGPPVNGSLNSIHTSVGSSVTFSCDTDYRIPDDYSDSLTCGESGYWDNVPKCTIDGPSCGQGWEKVNTSCYKVVDTNRLWDNAVTDCKNDGATLIEIYSAAEMAYLLVLLDHIGGSKYWTGGNCRIMTGFYSWSSNPYSQISYSKWFPGNDEGDFVQPSGLYDCVVLKRNFFYYDQGQLFFADYDCTESLVSSPDYLKELPYVCKKNLLNVGSTNCSLFGSDPCKQNSACVNDTCVCKEFFYQLGSDDVDSTACLPIQPVGSGPCYNMDEFCLNNASCSTSGICECPPGLHQNGESKSISTVCQLESVKCPDDWLQHNGHCYFLDVGHYSAPTVTVVEFYNDNDPAIHCGELNAYMAVIHDYETNKVVRKLGTSFGYRFIGLFDEFVDEKYMWSDESQLEYSNFEFQNKSNLMAVMMNPIGYWIKEAYTSSSNPLVINLPKGSIACEKPHLCSGIPAIPYAVVPFGPANLIGEEVGKEYRYTCNNGYVMAGLGYPFIKCREINRVSSWDNAPQCISLLAEKYIDVSNTQVKGDIVSGPFVATDNLNCATHCYEHSICEGFHFVSTSLQCTLYELQSDTVDIPTVGSQIWITEVCDPIPYVEHATFNASGRTFGDTVRYECQSNYRIARNTSATLTCLPTGRWDYDPPVCKGRFVRQAGAIYTLSGKQREKIYHNIFTADDCEVRCTKEILFRCILSIYRKGTCTLWRSLPRSHRKIVKYKKYIDGAVTSSLQDADVDMYGLSDKTVITSEAGLIHGVNTSYEICAQRCSGDVNNCTAFVYRPATSTCFIHFITDFIKGTAVDVEYQLFRRKHVCSSSPPSLPGITFEEVIRQNANAYFIGDLLEAKCDNYGEMIVAGHSGFVECLATGKWTPRLPACRNLCESGWYMLNSTCYRIYDTPMSFWDAFEHCHSHNAGLVNVYDVEEFNNIQDIWNNTGQISNGMWVGLYSDMYVWHWTERLGGDIGFEDFPAENLAAFLQMSNFTLKSDGVNRIHPFACEKAAAKLTCPSGWTQFRKKCFQVQTNSVIFDDAKTGCEALNSTLATAENLQEKDVLAQMAKENAGMLSYVGLYQDLHKQNKWVDGTVPRFSFVVTDEVADASKCGAVLLGNIQNDQIYFNREDCSASRSFICQKNIDYYGTPTDFSNLPCSTDGYCNHPSLACLGGIEKKTIYSPRCSGKECPPPWHYINGKCINVNQNQKLDYIRAAHHCWKIGGNLAVIDSFKEDYDLLDTLPSGQARWYLGLYAYQHDYLVNIKSKRLAGFPHRKAKEQGAFALDTSESIGKFSGRVIYESNVFLCEKEPVRINTSYPYYEGCFGESLVLYERDLPHSVFTDGTLMTVELCVNHCSIQGYRYAGIMKGDTCGCGNSRGNYGRKSDINGCPINCVGDITQDCGGNSSSSVYRTLEKLCYDGMPKNKQDPRNCYSYHHSKYTYSDNRFDCLHQGGFPIMPKTPVDEKHVYNQLLLGTLSFEDIVDGSTENSVWLGLLEMSKKWADDYQYAEWFLWDNKSYGSFWKWGAAADLISNGTWFVQFPVGGTVKSRTACEIYDYSMEDSGTSLHTEYSENGKATISTKYGNMNTSSILDFNCLINHDSCPEGFTIMFWFYINSTAQDSVLFSKGDCYYKQVILSPGLCVFYNETKKSLTVCHTENNVINQKVFSVELKVWKHLLLHFDRNESISLYIDGMFLSMLDNFTTVEMVNFVQSDVDIYTSDTDIRLQNVSFLAAAPDQSLLGQIRENPVKNRNEDKRWTTFQPWLVKPNIWNSPGVDGNGFILPYRSFIHHIGKDLFNSTCIHFQECWLSGKSLALWVKLPTSVGEKVDIFSFGNTFTSGAGIWLYYDVTTKRMKLKFNTLNKYEAEVSVVLGEWIHIALVLPQPGSPKFYVNGSLTETLFSTGPTTDASDTIIPTYFGTVTCPPEWSQFGGSCYKITNQNKKYWEHQHICESYGGNLVVIDDESELNFVKDLLYSQFAEVYLGVYNFHMDYPGDYILWMTTKGQRQTYIFFKTSAPDHADELDPISLFGYIAMTCDPDCDNGQRFSIVEDANFIGFGGLCEISQSSFSFRKEDSLRCPSGWWFWEDHCYLFTTSSFSGTAGPLHCASHDAVVVEIDSKDEQRFISNFLYRETPLPKTAHIGAKFVDLLPYPTDNIGQFVHGDFQPPGYQNWKTAPLNDPSTGCAVIDCSDRACPWRDISCTESWPLICEKSSKSHCSPGWEEFGDRCISIHDVTTTEQCSSVGSELVVFNTAAEVLEFTHIFDLNTKNCLTDGVLNSGSYSWKSTSQSTYFTDQTLTGVGNCVGITSTGLQNVDCSLYTCAVCQHYQLGDISIDNVHFLDNAISDSDVTNLFETEKYYPETYTFDMTSHNENSGTIYGMKSDNTVLELVPSGSENVTLVVGQGLIVTNTTSSLSYNVSDNDRCLQNLEHCHHSFGVSFWLYVNGSGVRDSVLVDTVTDGTTGMIVSVTDNGTRILVSLMEMNYKTESGLHLPLQYEWNYINIVWQKYIGLKFFINFHLVHNIDPTERLALFPATPLSLNTSYIMVGNCSIELDSSILLKDLKFGTNLQEDWENRIAEQIPRFIDFNEPKEKSKTNVNAKINTDLVTTYWMNSLFITAAKVDNPLGLTPAIEIPEQMSMCFSNIDACNGAFTLSLWLYPRNFKQSQTFLYSGIKSHSVGEIESMKMWYDTITDQYFLSLQHDRTKITFEFYIYLYEWSHLVLLADFSTHKVDMYLNAEKITTKTTVFVQNRVKPVYRNSFLRIGDVGTFDIDDLKFLPYAAEPSHMYVLKTCHEFMIAGLTGFKNETIDPDTLDDIEDRTIMECDLDLDYQGFHFPMEMNQNDIASNSIGVNTSVNFLDAGNVTYIPVIHYDGVLVNQSGFNISGLDDIKCFSDVKYCYFGFSLSAWIKVIDVSPVTGKLTLFELGGNVTQNENGIRVVCSKTSDLLKFNCSALVINGTDQWFLPFSVLKNQLLHITLTWNSHLNLVVALNGHSTADFGRFAEHTSISEAASPVIKRPSTVGYSVYEPDQFGQFMIDEVTILDDYLEDIQIKKLFGTKHECPEMWTYSPVTDKCYYLSDTRKTYDNAVSSCQALNAALVEIPDIETRTWLYDFLDTELILTPRYVYFQLTQLPRHAIGFQIRQPNGRIPDFPDNNLIAITDFSIPRCVRADVLSGYWRWRTVWCYDLNYYICEQQPMYVKESPYYVNDSNVDDEEFHVSGEITLERGVTNQSMTFNNCYIHMVHADDCLSNFDYCHNGIKIQFWLMTTGNLSVSSGQVLFSSMMTEESHGVNIYVTQDTSHYLLGIDIRSKLSFDSSTVSVSSNVWTYVSLFISSDSDIVIYLNGELATPYTINTNASDGSIRSFGVSTDLYIGSGSNGSNMASVRIDNMTFTESNVFSAISLKQQVYDFFPRFHLPFDNPSYRTPITVGSSAYSDEGYIGNALFSNVTYPEVLNFIGQFAYDCIGSQDLCSEGFTMFLWIIVPNYSYNYVIFSVANQNTGIMIDFRLTDFAETNKFWLTIRDGTPAEDHYPFRLETGVWSHIGMTWYTNGTKIIIVNGVEVINGFTRSISLVSNLDPVTQMQFGQTLPNTNLQTSIRSGVDEILAIRSPISQTDVNSFYENSTFIHNEFKYEFENMTSNSTKITGISNQASRFTSGIDSINLTSLVKSGNCFLDMDKCVHGLTVRFGLRFVKELDIDQVILTTGGDNPDGLGFAVSYTAMNLSLPFRRYFQIDVRTSVNEYRTWFNLQHSIWSDIKITWHPKFGTRVFVDDMLAVCEFSVHSPRLVPPVTLDQNLVISKDMGSELGIFDIDELSLLDVAVYETDLLHEGDNLWEHEVHVRPIGDFLLQHTEVTRDECHQLCIENVCDSYSFCTDEHFGTCNLYTNTTNATIPDQTCDSFIKYRFTQFPVQDAGCLTFTSFTPSTIADTIVLPPDIDCSWYCKNISSVYKYNSGSACYCAFSSLTELHVFDFENLTLPHSCKIAQVLVQQSTGLRDFIQPLRITSFNVTSEPDMFVLVNGTVAFEFEVNGGTFAGYRINAVDVMPEYYTSYNQTSLLFSDYGQFEIEVTALNEISSFQVVITILVFEPIEGVHVSHSEVVPTNTDVTFTVNIDKGSHITCDLDYGDGYSDSLFNFNATMPFIFTHQYILEQQAEINITCYNNLTGSSNFSSVITINPIVNLTLETPYLVIYGENISFNLTLIQGSNVSLEFHLNGVKIFSEFYLDPSNHSTFSIGVISYNRTGEHLINVTAWNPVSGPFNLSAIVHSDIEIYKASLNFHPYLDINNNATFNLLIANGSNVNVHVDFGDNSLNETAFLDDDIQIYNWNHDIFHQYLQPGAYNVTCYLKNSVTNLTLTGVIFVEVPVNDIVLMAMDVEDPFDFVNLTFSIPNSLLPPTNALMNISLGNGDSLDELPVLFIDNSMIVLYNYSINGLFTVNVKIWNSLGAINLTEVLMVGRPITNLTVSPNSIYVAVNEELTLSVNVGSGSHISYFVDFADSTIISTDNIYTYPSAFYVIRNTYSQVGSYVINVIANNTFGSEKSSIIVYVQKKIQGIVISSRHVGKMNYPMKYIIKVNEAGTNSCFHFDFGRRQQVVGGYNCFSKPEFLGMNFTYGEGNMIVFYMTFYEPGNYTMTVNGSNEVSWEIFNKKITILEFPCTYPEVSIYGFSSDSSSPTDVLASQTFVIRAISDTFCNPLQTVLFDWKITPIDPDNSNFSTATTDLPYLIIHSNKLYYGHYQINVTVLIQNYLEFNDTATIYINIVRTPLVLLLKGDESRSVRGGFPLVMDASWSYDPDYPLTGIEYNLTWFCWFPATVNTIFDPSNAVLHSMRSPSCYPTLNQTSDDQCILVIPSNLIAYPINYFVAVMTSGNRIEMKVQKTEISLQGIQDLIIKCVQNCRYYISASKPVRLKGICHTCTPDSRLGIDYKWRLFEVEPGINSEIVDFSSWTDTGISSPNLKINSGFLQQGKDYILRLESGAAYTLKHIHVVSAPYNGYFSSDIIIGEAFQSTFTFRCDEWLDEAKRPSRNLIEDQKYLYRYTFKFYYEVIGSPYAHRTPFFQMTGEEGKTPGVVFPPGNHDHDYRIRVYVEVEDSEFGKTTLTLDVQVLPFSQNSGHEVLAGFDMEACERERDELCILTFCDGLADYNSSHPEDVQLKDEVVSMIYDNKELIQDNLQMVQATSVLSKLSNNVRQLKPGSQDKMRTLFTDLVKMSETHLSDILSVADKERIGRDLLSSIAKFCQMTKYDPACSSGDCSQKFAQGNNAINLVDLVHNLTALMLSGNVAGESSTVIEIPTGNIKYQAQRRDSWSLINSTLDFSGLKTIRTQLLPSQVTDLETCDVMMMTSDNLYTTHQSTLSIKSQTTTFELLKSEGEKIKVSDLSTDMDITIYPSGLENLNFTLVNVSETTDSSMFFIQLRMNETNVIPVFVVEPEDLEANITYYVRKGVLPTTEEYDMTGSIPDCPVDEENSNRYLLRLDPLGSWSTGEILYIGLQANYNITEVSPMARVAMYVLGCYFWSGKGRKWSQEGLKLGPVRNTKYATCKTSHLSSFGMNMFVPPNTIDFTTVWSKFSTDNLAVFVTVGLVILAYFLLLIPVIRADRRDYKKWAIYPLSDNVQTDVYHYQVSVYTGLGQNAGTTSDVYFVLGGDLGDTEVRLLQDVNKRPMLRGSVNNYLLSVPEPLGSLLFLRIWLDNMEMTKVDDWLLNMILIRDIQTEERYAFLCDKWFALDKGDGQIDHLLPVASAEEMQSFGHLFFNKTRKDLTDGHLWFSVMSRPMHSTFTRAQRMSCCLSLLFMSMITNCMWYKAEPQDGEIAQNIHLGPFTFSSQEFFTSLMASLIVVPFNLIIVTLFRKSKPCKICSVAGSKSRKEESEKYADNYEKERNCATPSQIDTEWSSSDPFYPERNDNSTSNQHNLNQINRDRKTDKSKYPLPHWCIYVAWVLFILSVLASGFFTVLYSMEWGSDKSSKWLTSFLLSFVESVIMVQPLKVIMLAILIALIFKTIEADDSVEEVFIIGESPKTTVYPEHRQELLEDPVNVKTVTEAKEYRNKMNKLFETIRTILIYVVYLSVVAVLAYENRDVNSFPTYRNLHDIFINAHTKYDKSLSNIQSTNEFYTWMEGVVLPGLYSNGWYNDSDTELSSFISDNTFYRIGSPRIRQARIRNDDCQTPWEIREFIKDCYPYYNTRTFESRNFMESWTGENINSTDDAWTYKDTLELDGLPTVGHYGSYSGGGYVVELGSSFQTANDSLNYLESTRWIDRKTRGVFVEFNLFNANVNLFCSVILLLEYPPTGSVFPYWEISPLVMYRYVGPSAIFLFVFDAIFAAFTLYYLIDFIKELRKMGWRKYFTGLWRIVDFLNLILSIVCCAFYGVQLVLTRLTLNKFQEDRDKFINLQRAVLWDQLFGIILGFVLFLSMLKTLQLIRFNAKITQLFGTIKKLSRPLFNFMVVFILTFMAFASAGYLLFGPQNYEYSSILRSVETLMSMLMMKVNIDAILVVSGVLGSLYIFLFVLFVVFVLLNILLSIINEAFAEVKSDPSCQSDDPQMVDFLLQQLKRMIFGSSAIGHKQHEPVELAVKMERLEKRMNKYFIKFIQEESKNHY